MKKYIERISSLIAAIILLQTLYFKFTGAPGSVYIFSELGMEPYGRVGLGIVELITAVLLIVKRTFFVGALLGLGIMIGAIVSHLFVLGIEVQNDGGTLFALAVIVFIMCLITAILQKDKWKTFQTSGMSFETLFT
ncbi:MAG: DoxX family protein [Lutimonas sp.]